MVKPVKDRARKVKVQFHSGYKGEEIPRSVTLGFEECLIDKIFERKRILDHRTGKKREEFKIKLKDKKAILKVYDSQDCEITFLLS